MWNYMFGKTTETTNTNTDNELEDSTFDTNNNISNINNPTNTETTKPSLTPSSSNNSQHANRLRSASNSIKNAWQKKKNIKKPETIIDEPIIEYNEIPTNMIQKSYSNANKKGNIFTIEIENFENLSSDEYIEAVQKSMNKLNISQYEWPSCVRENGHKTYGKWCSPTIETAKVRGKQYLTNKIKCGSDSVLFQLADIQTFKCKTHESLHICTHPKSWYLQHRSELPSDTFYLVMNLQLSSINLAIIATFVLKTNQEPNFDFAKLVENDDQYRNFSMDHEFITDTIVEEKMDVDGSIPEITITSEHSEQKLEVLKHENIPSDEMQDMVELILISDSSIVDHSCTDELPMIIEDEQIPISKIEKDEIKEEKLDTFWYPNIGYGPYDIPCSSSKNSIWKQFLLCDEQFINSRLKLLPRIQKGSWYFSFPQQPVIIGTKGPQKSFRGSNYLEIDCIADKSMIAAKLTQAASMLSTCLVIDIMFTIEGRNARELPERILCGYQFHYLNIKKVRLLNETRGSVVVDDEEEDSEYESTEEVDEYEEEEYTDNGEGDIVIVEGVGNSDSGSLSLD